MTNGMTDVRLAVLYLSEHVSALALKFQVSRQHHEEVQSPISLPVWT
jgi:hypothetical protein